VILRMAGLSLLRRSRRRVVVLAAVALGTSAAAALANIALDVGDKIGRELNSFGANIVVLPQGGGAPVLVGGEDVSALKAPSYLDAEDLPGLRDNFWKNNILAIAPVLDVPARVDRTHGDPGTKLGVVLRGTWFDRSMPSPEPELRTGVRRLYPYWKVAGDWPRESGIEDSRTEALAGDGLAKSLGLRAGDELAIEVAGRTETLAIAGVLSAGPEEDQAILLPIEAVWRLAGLEGRVTRVFVRALTTPESAVYDRLRATPKEMPPEQFERWTCTPFPSSIAFELSRAMPGSEARVIRRVSESEGTILGRISGLMAIIAILAAISSALAVTSALSTGILERRGEISLLKSLGAGNGRVLALFLAEAAVLGLLGGVLGAGAGALMARFISVSVFGAPVAIRPLALPMAIGVALLITIAGCIVPARRVLLFRPAEVLRGL
jgi:putative ABC transport system permease protein